MRSLPLISPFPNRGRNFLGGISTGATYAFNVFNAETARGVIEASVELNHPIYLQTSASIVRAYSPAGIYGMVEALIPRQWRENVRVHLDHCDDFNLILECIESGWDSVMIDASAYALADNIARTRRVVERAHENGVLVEGEIGVLDGVEDGCGLNQPAAARATPSECKLFIEETGVDLAAIGIGNRHGYYDSGACNLDIELMAKVHLLCPETPLVLHGGSGIPPVQISAAITRGGVRKVNLSTELKDAYLGAMSRHLSKTGEQDRHDMNRCIGGAVRAVKELAVEKLMFIQSLEVR